MEDSLSNWNNVSRLYVSVAIAFLDSKIILQIVLQWSIAETASQNDGALEGIAPDIPMLFQGLRAIQNSSTAEPSSNLSAQHHNHQDSQLRMHLNYAVQSLKMHFFLELTGFSVMQRHMTLPRFMQPT